LLTRTQVYVAIDAERDHQDKKWGGPDHDATHEVESWITYMRVYLRRAEEAMMGVNFSKAEAMANVRKITALGVACMEYHYEGKNE
jgi:hypothetical protein